MFTSNFQRCSAFLWKLLLEHHQQLLCVNPQALTEGDLCVSPAATWALVQVWARLKTRRS